MKVICINSRTVKTEGGGFKQYVKGQTYDVNEIDKAIFRPIKDTKKPKPGGKEK